MKIVFALLAMLFAVSAQAEIRDQVVEYRTADTVLKGYIAWDDAVAGKRPGVLVVHEWWGLNDYARKRARMLAELGYTAMAVDMYGDGRSTEHPDEAKGFMQAVMSRSDVARERFLAAKSVLEKHDTVDPKRLAAIGYCFGGATVLNMARQGIDLAAVVSFHGSLGTDTPAKVGAVKARVAAFNGAADTFIPEDSIRAFEKEMTEAKVNYRFVNYPGVKHGFTNPDADRLARETKLSIAYNADADRQSWQAMRDLFDEVFKP